VNPAMTHSTSPSTPGDTGPGRPRRRSTRIVLALAVAGALAAAVATVVVSRLGGDPANAPAVFVTQPDYQPGATPPCLLHQDEQPNAAYQGGEDSQSVPQLTFLAYYTAAGQEPFCDGQPATDTDKAWAQLYVQLTSNPDNVSAILG